MTILPLKSGWRRSLGSPKKTPNKWLRAGMDILGLLGRIEQASARLWEIGQLTPLGAERLKVHETCLNLQVIIGRISTILSGPA
jgi:hypothetical protein